MSSPAQSTLTDFTATPPNATADPAPLTVHIDDIHLIGIVPNQPSATARLTTAITRHDPDVIGISATPQRIINTHPDMFGPTWPSTNSVEVAAYATTHLQDLYITSIDSPPDFSELRDRLMPIDVITDRINELTTTVYPDDLVTDDGSFTIERFHTLDLDLLREWRHHARKQIPDIYTVLVADRDDFKAGCLNALAHAPTIDSIVAPITLHSLPGVLDRLRDPDRIPGENHLQPSLLSFTTPPEEDYNTTYA